MNAYQRMARAMEIFNSYPADADISCQHDEMWAGPDPSDVSAEHLKELDVLGWMPEDGTFHRFV